MKRKFPINSDIKELRTSWLDVGFVTCWTQESFVVLEFRSSFIARM